MMLWIILTVMIALVAAGLTIPLVRRYDQRPDRARTLDILKGQLVELRVLGPAAVRPVSAYDESDVMLDPWVELPQPTPMFSVVGEFGPIALPDVPEIPDDGDGDGA